MHVRIAVVAVGSTISAIGLCVAILGISPPSAAARQTTKAIDFVRDVQPIFRQHCYECHGPKQQMNNFRLDRRRDALRGGTVPQIGRGNSAGSRLFHRLRGTTYGQQMPPTGALPDEQIAVIKAWIDQGAVWPDEAAGDVAVPPIDRDAAAVVARLRDGETDAFLARLRREPRLINARGPGGTTPFMYAIVYADEATIRELIAKGADVNARNDAGATPLLWAAADVAKARLLIESGADINARSLDGRTPLLVAAGASIDVVKLLLEKGANVNARGQSRLGPAAGVTPLTEAALTGNDALFRLLLEAGADPKAAGTPALVGALRSGCACAEVLLESLTPQQITSAMLVASPPRGDATDVPRLLQHGGNAAARDSAGRSLLMLAAASPSMPTDVVKALVAAGADVNLKAASGETALMLAARHGDTAMVKTLRDLGGDGASAPPPPAPSPARSPREAVDRALPLLDKADDVFLRKSGCASCHNNALTAMTFDIVRKQGRRVDEARRTERRERVAAYLDQWRERALQGVHIGGEASTISFMMLGLAAAGHPPDFMTDAQAMILEHLQEPDGGWRFGSPRPPMEFGDIPVTAMSMRVLQVYAPKSRRPEFDAAVAKAAAWLRAAEPRTTDDRAYHLFGLHWSNAPKEAIERAARDLIAEQRADGGWAQIPTLASDAYATGQALTALAQAGALPPTDPAYRRGVDFLLGTQLADGSWWIRTRALPLQPYFDAEFPHGVDQYISAAATNWATMALALARE